MCFSGVGNDSRSDVVGKSGTTELLFLTCPGLCKHLRYRRNCPKAMLCSWAFILKDQRIGFCTTHTLHTAGKLWRKENGVFIPSLLQPKTFLKCILRTHTPINNQTQRWRDGSMVKVLNLIPSNTTIYNRF